MIVKTQRKFLPSKIKVTSWDVIEPYYTQLLNREINSVNELENWLKDRSELDAFLSEDLAWRYVRMTCDTENKSLEEAYLFFVTEIEPQISPLNNELNKKLINNTHFETLNNNPSYFIYLRGVKQEIALFREENVQLYAQIATESQKYGAIVGGLTVEIEGKELTMQQAANFLKSPDREKREEAFIKINEKRLSKSKELDDLFDKLIALRHQVAINAGYTNFRDYMFAALGRFDYTAQDCFNFHD